MQRMQGMRIRQSPRCISPKPVDQGSQESHLEQIDFINPGNSPGLKLWTTRKGQIFEELAPK
jgi:hypothetical protein